MTTSEDTSRQSYSRAKTERHAKRFGNLVAEQTLVDGECYCAYMTSTEEYIAKINNRSA